MVDLFPSSLPTNGRVSTLGKCLMLSEVTAGKEVVSHSPQKPRDSCYGIKQCVALSKWRLLSDVYAWLEGIRIKFFFCI